MAEPGLVVRRRATRGLPQSRTLECPHVQRRPPHDLLARGAAPPPREDVGARAEGSRPGESASECLFRDGGPLRHPSDDSPFRSLRFFLRPNAGGALGRQMATQSACSNVRAEERGAMRTYRGSAAGLLGDLCLRLGGGDSLPGERRLLNIPEHTGSTSPAGSRQYRTCRWCRRRKSCARPRGSLSSALAPLASAPPGPLAHRGPPRLCDSYGL
jgi:hypothetical protein